MRTQSVIRAFAIGACVLLAPSCSGPTERDIEATLGACYGRRVDGSGKIDSGGAPVLDDDRYEVIVIITTGIDYEKVFAEGPGRADAMKEAQATVERVTACPMKEVVERGGSKLSAPILVCGCFGAELSGAALRAIASREDVRVIDVYELEED